MLGRGLPNLERYCTGARVSRELLTWREATSKLGWPDGGTDAAGRRLKRVVLAREVQSGRQIATRTGSGPAPQLRVTVGAVLRHLPELRRTRFDRFQANMTKLDTGITGRVSGIVADQLAELVDPRLDELWERDEVLAQEQERTALQVESLSKAVEVIHRRLRRRPNPTKSDHGEPVDQKHRARSQSPDGRPSRADDPGL